MNYDGEISVLYNQITDTESRIICNEFKGEVELDYVKSLIKESIDPLFYFESDNKFPDGIDLNTNWLFEQYFGVDFYYRKFFPCRPFKNEEEKKIVSEKYIEKYKIFDNQEEFDIFDKMYNNNVYDYDEMKKTYPTGFLKEIINIKLDYIKDRLKKEVEEKRNKKFTDFLSSEFEKKPLEESLTMYKNFTEDQKMLFTLNIAKDIKEIKSLLKNIDEK